MADTKLRLVMSCSGGARGAEIHEDLEKPRFVLRCWLRSEGGARNFHPDNSEYVTLDEAREAGYEFLEGEWK